jgi:hypothetical protein
VAYFVAFAVIGVTMTSRRLAALGVPALTRSVQVYEPSGWIEIAWGVRLDRIAGVAWLDGEHCGPPWPRPPDRSRVSVQGADPSFT